MNTFRVAPRFESELEAAIKWYETVSAQVADNFRLAVSNCFESISDYPDSHPIVELPVRAGMVKRFPWVIVFIHEPGIVYLTRFVHSASSQLILPDPTY